MFIYIDLTTKDSKALNICSLNSAISYCRFKYGKHQLRVNASDIALKDVNVTTIKKKA
jgi:hypothetical protein